MSKLYQWGIISFAMLMLVLSACTRPERSSSRETAERLMKNYQQVPLGLYASPTVPDDNPMSVDKVELGYLLYFDKRLSFDNTVSCASCHHPDKGWTDQARVSTGILGQQGARSAPTVVNAAYMFSQFWDGRAGSLEEQALGPLINPIEMGNPDHASVVKQLKAIPGYDGYFQKAFGESVSKENIAKAIAAFERTILAANSRHDRYAQGDTTVLTTAENHGRELFFGKANCSRCHVGENFSDSQFHNIGVGMAAAEPDLGRHDHTKEEAQKGAFKTPTVRDITKTAPYMHDGSQLTLEEVVEFYDIGGEKNEHLDVLMIPLNLTDQEKADLVAFLKTLESEPYPHVPEPKRFPQ
jgi:cytochrome c peroxidase